MKYNVKVCSFGVALVSAMLVSLIAPIHAIADDTTPPPPVQTDEPPPVGTEEAPPIETEEVDIPLEGESSDDEPVNDQQEVVVDTDVPLPMEGEATGDEPINDQETEQGDEQEIIQDEGNVGEESPQDVSEIIEQLPEGTGIHLETEAGVEPMATAQAESLILVGDPIWCPAAVTDPAPNSNGCSGSYPDLADLVNNFPDPGAPGVIWITEGTDLSATFISLDGANYANWDLHNLVIQGGWDGAPLGGVISSATTINVPLEIINWAGNITINDIIVSGAAGTGLSVDINGNVNLNDVETSGNHDLGLYVNSAGVVTAEDIVANNNGIVSLSGYGAMIQGSEFHLSGTNEFNGNYDSGLYVSTTGDITIENLTASSNGPGYAVGAELYSTSGDVDLVGNNHFIGNHNDGLYIESPGGTITAENVVANDNGVGNTWGPGAEFFAAGLELTGNNEFIGNYNTGLYADVTGDITLMNINASDNGSPGYGPGAELYSGGAVTITGLNVFSGNSPEGLVIVANGNISLLNFNAQDNNGSGLVFVTNGDVYAECGSVLNNGSAQIDTAMTGVLTLAGVDFGGDPDQNVWIDQSQLNLVSNMCFNYPDYYSEGDYGYGDFDGKKGYVDPGDPPLILRYVSIVGGQDVNLDCNYYNATYVLMENGDGAIIPCPISGSAELDKVEEINPYGELPDVNLFVSGMRLAISGEDQTFKPVTVQDVVWFFNGANNDSGGYEAVYWDGSDWVDITEQIPPFLTVFFLVPEEFDPLKLAILYWDGTQWIELSNGTHLGQGRIVSGLGYDATGNYFQANVNFTGVFVLVEK